MTTSGFEDARCIEVVELFTAYLDGTLGPDVSAQLDRHLDGCQGCQVALAQWRAVIDLAGRLSSADLVGLDPYLRQRFLTALTAPRRK